MKKIFLFISAILLLAGITVRHQTFTITKHESPTKFKSIIKSRICVGHKNEVDFLNTITNLPDKYICQVDTIFFYGLKKQTTWHTNTIP